MSSDESLRSRERATPSMFRPGRAPGESSALLDTRGAVSAEYVTLLALISIGCAGATVALGIPLTNLFVFQRALLLLPVP